LGANKEPGEDFLCIRRCASGAVDADLAMAVTGRPVGCAAACRTLPNYFDLKKPLGG
jgi:hypothetical protein